MLPIVDTKPESFVLYDGECLICRSYMAIAQLRKIRPDLQVIDARQSPAIVADMRALGHEVNDSLLVKVGSRIYAQGDATQLISELGSQHAVLRRAALWTIGGAPWSGALYPFLRGTRNALLALLGRQQIG
jgi:predicted DCC family thiol-disulfide oxidoreductase YuxK